MGKYIRPSPIFNIAPLKSISRVLNPSSLALNRVEDCVSVFFLSIYLFVVTSHGFARNALYKVTSSKFKSFFSSVRHFLFRESQKCVQKLRGRGRKKKKKSYKTSQLSPQSSSIFFGRENFGWEIWEIVIITGCFFFFAWEYGAGWKEEICSFFSKGGLNFGKVWPNVLFSIFSS